MRSLLNYAWSDPPNFQSELLEQNWPGSRYTITTTTTTTSTEKKEEERPPLKKIKPNPVTIRCITSTGTTDTFFHQSRRKKRDTKPPNTNDIRQFIQVQKREGQYVLPAEVDSWTVLDLGVVIWDRAAFHNQRYIYPVGYRVKK